MVVGGALVGAPAADAAAIRPAVTTGFGCIAESVGRSEGTVDCYVTPAGGVAPYTMAWAETGDIGDAHGVHRVRRAVGAVRSRWANTFVQLLQCNCVILNT